MAFTLLDENELDDDIFKKMEVSPSQETPTISPFERQIQGITDLMLKDKQPMIDREMQNKNAIAHLGDLFKNYTPTAAELLAKTNTIENAENLKQQQMKDLQNLIQAPNQTLSTKYKDLLDAYKATESSRQFNETLEQKKKQYETTLEEAKKRFEANQTAQGKEQEFKTTKQRTDLENQLRDEVNKITEPVKLVETQYTSMKNSAGMASAAGDLSLLYNYMKILDPTSVVREGEYATAANAGSVPQIIQNFYNKALTGQKLTAEQRADFLKAGQQNLSSRKNEYQKQIGAYKNIVKNNKLDPQNIFTWEANVNNDSNIKAETPISEIKKESSIKDVISSLLNNNANAADNDDEIDAQFNAILKKKRGQ
jgi:hypothetical protein